MRLRGLFVDDLVVADVAAVRLAVDDAAWLELATVLVGRDALGLGEGAASSLLLNGGAIVSLQTSGP